ncbi:MAG: PIG-L deacetylase family protein [Candidatus Yanofskybacteria bacterium]|nr:PIG-L deacetylase family protein [Candidatus Yanofskybacteria bacterium]
MPVFAKKKKVLVISPHPDDSDFGCAGTLARLVREGSDVYELILLDGSKGSHKTGFGGKKLARIREREQKNAADVLGVSSVHFLRETDGELENTKKLRGALVAFIRDLRPDIIFTFDPASSGFESTYRSHRDHRVGAETVFDAVYPAVGNISFFPALLKKGLAPHQVEELWFFSSDSPNRFIDVSSTMQLKLQAVLSHESQWFSLDQTKGHILARARAAGKKKRVKYGEAFRVLVC